MASNNMYSAQDASAQLKAILFGGAKDSAPSSGTASPLPNSEFMTIYIYIVHINVLFPKFSQFAAYFMNA